MAKRQTINVELVKEKVNTYLAELPTGKTPEETVKYKYLRFGARTVLETILHETGNYKGYAHNDSPFVSGVSDDSRRHYY